MSKQKNRVRHKKFRAILIRSHLMQHDWCLRDSGLWTDATYRGRLKSAAVFYGRKNAIGMEMDDEGQRRMLREQAIQNQAEYDKVRKGKKK